MWGAVSLPGEGWVGFNLALRVVELEQARTESRWGVCSSPRSHNASICLSTVVSGHSSSSHPQQHANMPIRGLPHSCLLRHEENRGCYGSAPKYWTDEGRMTVLMPLPSGRCTKTCARWNSFSSRPYVAYTIARSVCMCGMTAILRTLRKKSPWLIFRLFGMPEQVYLMWRNQQHPDRSDLCSCWQLASACHDWLSSCSSFLPCFSYFGGRGGVHVIMRWHVQGIGAMPHAV